MRKGFDGLFALVENVIREDPFSGHLFVFRNHRRDRLKVLWWDRDGLAIFYKKHETEHIQKYVFTECPRSANNRGACVFEAGKMD
jgi:hypothetical protein